MSEEEKEYKGRAASKGIASGMAAYIISPSEYHKRDFSKGNVLVTKMTDVDYLPLMRKASAVVTQYGGKFSHAAVICRQLKKPCVVGLVTGITMLDGNKVTVNGTTGQITREVV